MALVPFEAGVAVVGAIQAGLGAYLHLRNQPGGDIVMAGVQDGVLAVHEQVRGQIQRFEGFRRRPGNYLRERPAPDPPQLEQVEFKRLRGAPPTVVVGNLSTSEISFKRERYPRRRRRGYRSRR